MQKRVHIVIDGHVQGVGFRWSAVKWARQCSALGVVRNLPEGSVELIAEGKEALLLALLAKLRMGPAGARVVQLRDTWSEPTGEFSDFHIES